MTQFTINKKHFPGYVEPMNVANDQTWIQAIFPYVEQTALSENWSSYTGTVTPPPSTLTPRINLLICPSNREDWLGAFNSYCANGGRASQGILASTGVYTMEGSENGIFAYRGSLAPSTPKPKITDASIKDGLSNTLLLSENLQASDWYVLAPTLQVVGTPPPAPPATYGLKSGVVMSWFTSGATVVNPPSATWMSINGDKYDLARGSAPRPSSEHPSIVIAAMGDGSAFRLSEKISYLVYAQLLVTDATKVRAGGSGPLTYILNESDYKN
ncbi:DUF1559 domain-containing protein [Blastopirellula sp. JC732]|uniref:DUF1559 domain-containing protein n=1 Tax=Blastopirellula sediminis TaxID=2894196 RepID=A0A9X1MJP6_9BACT|nr:DUF1559 domain-containing protein [Blastopirellula sediminis]MCC9627560.1 DUF1559 domain-containing protein [Blastopirellula sediminis]